MANWKWKHHWFKVNLRMCLEIIGALQRWKDWNNSAFWHLHELYFQHSCAALCQISLSWRFTEPPSADGGRERTFNQNSINVKRTTGVWSRSLWVIQFHIRPPRKFLWTYCISLLNSWWHLKFCLQFTSASASLNLNRPAFTYICPLLSRHLHTVLARQ